MRILTWFSRLFTRENNYFIKQGYKINQETVPFNDDTESALSWQIEVYKLAARIAKKDKAKSVLDIGCGHGEKLVKYIYPIVKNINGVDLEHSIKYCKRNFKVGKWVVDDIESTNNKLTGKYDLIISSDVIEHLYNPDKLLVYIKKFANERSTILVSTPERDKVYGKKSFGPPLNPSHVREWNKSELRKYLESSGLKVIKHEIVYSSRSGKINGVYVKRSKSCQVVVCKLKDEK